MSVLVDKSFYDDLNLSLFENIKNVKNGKFYGLTNTEITHFKHMRLPINTQESDDEIIVRYNYFMRRYVLVANVNLHKGFLFESGIVRKRSICIDLVRLSESHEKYHLFEYTEFLILDDYHFDNCKVEQGDDCGNYIEITRNVEKGSILGIYKK